MSRNTGLSWPLFARRETEERRDLGNHLEQNGREEDRKAGGSGERRKGKAVPAGRCRVFSLHVSAKTNRFTYARARLPGAEPACHEAQCLTLGRRQSFKDCSLAKVP